MLRRGGSRSTDPRAKRPTKSTPTSGGPSGPVKHGPVLGTTSRDRRFSSTKTVVKRQLSGATPEEARQVVKRRKVDYARVTKAGISRAIIPEGYPDQQPTTKQVESLDEAITKLIDGLPEEGPLNPQFLDCYLSRGTAIVIAENEESLTWLLSLVAGIQPWEEARLTMLGLDQLLIYMVWIPGRPEDSDVLLGRMARQTHGLNPVNWRIYDWKVEERGVRLVVSMDSREVDKVVGKKIFCGMRTATFTLVEGKRARRETNPGTGNEPGHEPRQDRTVVGPDPGTKKPASSSGEESSAPGDPDPLVGSVSGDSGPPTRVTQEHVPRPGQTEQWSPEATRNPQSRAPRTD